MLCTFISLCLIRLPKPSAHDFATPKIVVEEVPINNDLEAGSAQRGRQPRVERDGTLVDVSDS